MKTQEAEGIQLADDLFVPQDYDMVVLDGNQLVSPVTVSGIANEFNNTQIQDAPSQADSLTSTVDLGITGYGRDARVEGSQYIFMTYATSGSGVTQSANYWITSSRYDYHEPLGPVIMGSRISEISNVTNNRYDIDIYGSKAFNVPSAYAKSAANNYKTIYSSSQALYQNDWTSVYGLRIEPTYDNNVGDYVAFSTSHYWSLSGSYGLQFSVDSGVETVVNARVKLPAFFYKQEDPLTHNRLYRINIEFATNFSSYTSLPYFDIYFGDVGSDKNALSVYPSATPIVTYTTKATGPWLVFNLNTDFLAAGAVSIKKLKVECLNYRADVQDFHLQNSYGMRNARYDGSKMTSADFNIDSPDTIDKGPVVQVVVGGGTQLSVMPGFTGNFEID